MEPFFGALATARTERDPIFGFDVVAECPNVPRDILLPRTGWTDPSVYDADGAAAGRAVP
jgi:phosphoenolpyruvate carboxykinase (ATP)